MSVLLAPKASFENHVRTVAELVNQDLIVKRIPELLEDDCRSYAYDQPYSRVEPMPDRFREILTGRADRDALSSVAAETRQDFEDAARSTARAFLETRAIAEGHSVGAPKDFSQLWGEGSATVAGSVAKSHPERNVRRICKRRGYEALLSIRSIRLRTIYYLWLVHSGCFGVQGAPRKMAPGDVGDFLHAIEASAADIFVTQESRKVNNKLPQILGQIDVPGFSVMNLHELLASV